jgi:hypothetical protein
MPVWKYDEQYHRRDHFLNLLSVITCAFIEDGSATRNPPQHHADPSGKNTRPTYRESLLSSMPASRGASVSSCERQKLEPKAKFDPRGTVDEPSVAVKPTIPKPKPKPPKVIQKPGVRSEIPVRHVAKLIMFKGKVAAEWGEVSFANSNSAAGPKRALLKEDANMVDVSAPKHALLSKSQRLKRRRAFLLSARRAHSADMGFLSEQISKKKSTEPVSAPMWLQGVLMVLHVALAKAVSGLSKACMLRKWLLRAAAMWMVVQTTGASPIAAAEPPAPMPQSCTLVRLKPLLGPDTGTSYQR